ncbi:MAG: PTS sugar transporter subunit IIA [Phycisphaerae bacterium]|nr:PTS sugar transporter subunit IIA [Phycisphaerae bacterium]
MQLTVRDAARILSVSEKTIYRWINQGSVPAYKVNEQYRFNRAELLEWATSRRINVSVEILHEPESCSVPLPTLLGALRAGGIVYRLGGTDKASVLKSLVEYMRVPEEVDREFLYRVLLAREALGSTGIGEGIAIPHVRNPIVLHVPQPMITLCFLEQPIDFQAFDGQPVDTLFSLISPTVRAHLHLLSRLSFALRDATFKETIRTQRSRDEIIREVERVERSFVPVDAAPAKNPENP